MSVIVATKENTGLFWSSFLFVFADFRMGLSAENLPYRRKGQFPVSGIFRAGGISDNKMSLSRNNLLNFRATFSLVNKRISARSENSTDWKLALRDGQSKAGKLLNLTGHIESEKPWA